MHQFGAVTAANNADSWLPVEQGSPAFRREAAAGAPFAPLCGPGKPHCDYRGHSDDHARTPSSFVDVGRMGQSRSNPTECVKCNFVSRVFRSLGIQTFTCMRIRENPTFTVGR